MIIDFSAHDTWDFCPAAWYEKYINKRRKKWPKAQRDDALALGSLVHEGLRVWQQRHLVEIPSAVVEEVTPTLDCYNLAQELVWGYTRAYPEEMWPLVVCEEPLQMPLLSKGSLCGYCFKDIYAGDCRCDNNVWLGEGLDLLAKIDTYFYVPELTPLSSGIPGLTFTLTPGWWIHEYKTKSPRIPIGIYMQSWDMGMQASYQTLALQYHLKKRLSYPGAPSHEGAWEVQGVLVNVLEKPERYIPKRRCKECEEDFEFYRWLPTGTGLYACPQCGTRKQIKPLKETPPVNPPNYYRVLVTRDERQLERAREEILMVGRQMIEMAAGGLHSHEWRHKHCADIWWKRPCDYYLPHREGGSTLENVDYEEVPEYRGLIQIEGLEAV